MKRASLVLLAVLGTLGTATTALAESKNSDENAPYPFIEFGFAKGNLINDTDMVDYHTNWRPSVGFGIGYDYQLAEDWVIESRLSLDFSTGNIAALPFDTEQDKQYGDMDAIGLWAATKLKRQYLYKNMSPYIEVSYGSVNVDYRLDDHFGRDRIDVYKAEIGVDFEVAEGFHFLLGFAVTNQDDIEGLNKNDF